MIFAFATDDCTLQVFETEADAISYCEGPDVNSGKWQFFGDDGSSLVAVFSEPVERTRFTVSQGRYHLQRGSDSSLLGLLPRVEAVEGLKGMCSVSDVHRFLTMR